MKYMCSGGGRLGKERQEKVDTGLQMKVSCEQRTALALCGVGRRPPDGEARIEERKIAHFATDY
ncbi:hypothetical protein E2C01_069964 [Portunus trituberculatus]|uniref:Uncharacterized protein n=1 Tax=Portunus trituberculatus TaxID=210409 RepID=A0A5B7I471_PORTR|nr:hypothetical protein [Portunus trituberculatus]